MAKGFRINPIASGMKWPFWPLPREKKWLPPIREVILQTHQKQKFKFT
jgi:hypothetical protein